MDEMMTSVAVNLSEVFVKEDCNGALLDFVD
jgi:hypothetical protein